MNLRPTLFLFALSFGGCYMSYERVELEEATPPVEDGPYVIEFVSRSPVAQVAIEHWHGGGERYRVEPGCYVRDDVSGVSGHACAVSLTPGEAAIQFNVAVYTPTADPEDGQTTCALDPEAEAALGEVRITRNGEDVPFERVPAHGSCYYRAL